MAEYQYYEFQAIDRPLSDKDKNELRRISSRAKITSTRFTNVYNWGDFHGKPRKLMERFFDLHLYVANWGTRRVMMRFPKALVDRSRVDGFVRDVEEVEVFESEESLIVDIHFDSESTGYYYPDIAGEGQLDSLGPLRLDVLSGDLRLFYLLWLSAADRCLLPDDEREPIPGIGPLSVPHTALAEFFGIDRDLVEAAAESLGKGDSAKPPADTSRSIVESIPDQEKTDLLLRLADGDPHVVAEVRSRIRVAQQSATREGGTKRRTVAELRKRGLAMTEKRRTREAERREAERLRKAREAERAQRNRLESIRRRGVLKVWDDVEREIANKNAKSYDRALGLLVDLRALAKEAGSTDDFAMKVETLRGRHRTKRAFINRLDKHRLGLG